jgi:uncharacterized protein YwqG
MGEPNREELEAQAQCAVLVRRSDFPSPLSHPARSYFGGLPRLPVELDWPTGDVPDENRINAVSALTFVAQIDLSEVPKIEFNPLPETGTLYFFCSSIFCGEPEPPCRVLYHHATGDAHPERKPPPNLMPLGGDDGEYQVKWLDPTSDFHSKVEFKYPISFHPFRDFPFQEDLVGGELLIESLCEALGPGEPFKKDLLIFRSLEEYQADPDWPFNWMLITHAARSMIHHVQDELRPSPYRDPLRDEIRDLLQHIEVEANHWLDRSTRSAPLELVDAGSIEAFRTWWIEIVRKFEGMDRRQLAIYTSAIQDDLGHAIDYGVKYMASQGEQALAHVPRNYVENFKQRNHWKTPDDGQGACRLFWTAVHQILGFGSSWQDAPIEHRKDVLLLQVQGDSAFCGWHENCGCVLHFWISREALSNLDFSEVEATLQCD